MSFSMLLVVAHLWIIGITAAAMVRTFPGVIRRLSSDAATADDWRSVIRRTAVPQIVFPPLASLFAFLVIYHLSTGNAHIALGLVTNFVNSYLILGIAGLVGLWAMVLATVWYQRGMPRPDPIRSGGF